MFCLSYNNGTVIFIVELKHISNKVDSVLTLYNGLLISKYLFKYKKIFCAILFITQQITSYKIKKLRETTGINKLQFRLLDKAILKVFSHAQINILMLIIIIIDFVTLTNILEIKYKHIHNRTKIS